MRIKHLAFTALALALLLPLLLAINLSSDTPLASNPELFDTRAAARIKRISTQLNHGLSHTWQRTIRFSEKDINALLALITRKSDHWSGSGKIEQDILLINISLHVPENPFGDYINIQLGIPDTKQSFTFNHLKLGSISIPGDWAQAIGRAALNHVLGDVLTTELTGSIKAVRIRHGYVRVTYKPPMNITEKVTTLMSRTSVLNKAFTLPANPTLIPVYYSHLCQMKTPSGKSSLGIYLSSLFTLAKQQSKAGDTAEHNKAALFALAVFLGSEKFNVFTGAMSKQTLQKCQPKAPVTTLMARQDLSLHFIYSAAFKLISDSDISFSVGELKELQDSLRGGSGFSFVDLAADRTGIRFAELATSPASATFVQQRARELGDEKLFFPDISELKEGISQQQFEKKHGGLQGEFYAQQLADIQRRIAATPLYRDW